MNSGRRQFVQGIGSLGVLALAGKGTLMANSKTVPMPWPKVIGSPVLDSLHPVIERSRDVRTHIDRLREIAGWMAYE
jgi:hypothetical protein